MNLVKIKEIVEIELCKIIYEKTEIIKEQLINEDYLNEYNDEDLDKPTKLFYKVNLKSPFSSVVNGSKIYDLKFEIELHLETKEHKTIAELLLFLSNDREIVNRFKGTNNKLKINIKDVTLLQSGNFTHNNETFHKEVITFNIMYEEEYNGDI